MPEGHTVHRIARQLTLDLVGRPLAVSSPQGRFAAGAELLDGRTMTAARAHGKHLFASFAPRDGEPDGPWLRVHLGLYGAWTFHGAVTPLGDGVHPVSSLGAPRRAFRMGEGELELTPADDDPRGPGGSVAPGAVPDFPPPPIGQVRVRLATDAVVADLRGPSACEVLTREEVDAVVAKAGPDPAVDPGAEDEFVRRLTRRRVAVGQLLMDQDVVAGIGNIYRAEMLFRAELDPYVPGNRVGEDLARELWRDWTVLLADGIRTGVMITREDLDDALRERALTDRTVRHAVYGRAGEPCLRCGTTVALAEMAGRKLYWCPGCQRS